MPTNGLTAEDAPEAPPGWDIEEIVTDDSSLFVAYKTTRDGIKAELGITLRDEIADLMLIETDGDDSTADFDITVPREEARELLYEYAESWLKQHQ